MGLGATSAMLLAACGESESETTTVAATPAPANAAPATAAPTTMPEAAGDAMAPRENVEIRFVTDHTAGPRGSAKSPGAAVPRATAPTTSRTW